MTFRRQPGLVPVIGHSRRRAHGLEPYAVPGLPRFSAGHLPRDALGAGLVGYRDDAAHGPCHVWLGSTSLGLESLSLWQLVWSNAAALSSRTQAIAPRCPHLLCASGLPLAAGLVDPCRPLGTVPPESVTIWTNSGVCTCSLVSVDGRWGVGLNQ